MYPLNTEIGRLRTLGFIEGVSMVLLLFIAMPLKYLFDSPGMVKVVGMAHGVLFMAFVMYTIYVSISRSWEIKKAVWILLASIVPFGPFYVDKKILSKEASSAEQRRDILDD